MKGSIGPAIIFTATLIFGLAGPVLGQKQKVHRNVSSQHLEGILKEMDIDFKKVPGKSEGIAFYDFERGKQRLRLHNYRGNDLWIDVIFPPTSLEQINRWNRQSLFSRAVLFKGDKAESTSLECQLDCQGGVTDGMIRRFIRRFRDEVENFDKFLKRNDGQ